MSSPPGPATHAVRAPQTYPDVVRLVSLLPSATEIVYALGLGEELVGVTFECDEPPAARSAQGPAWSTASRPSPRYSTRMPCPPHRLTRSTG
jgi:ABC-type Fe3+-hydroxamate transport system substrate-binding protein